jgi:hypothetical protein
VTGRQQAQVVEIDAAGLKWIKSSTSGAASTSCVEAANAGSRVIVRSSRNRGGSTMSHPWPAWTALLAWLRLDDRDSTF